MIVSSTSHAQACLLDFWSAMRCGLWTCASSRGSASPRHRTHQKIDALLIEKLRVTTPIGSSPLLCRLFRIQSACWGVFCLEVVSGSTRGCIECGVSLHRGH